MRRATITIGDDIEAQLDSWMRQQDAAPPLTAALRGFATAPRKLRITPSKKGSGSHDVSIAHDRYLAGN